ncbi:PREDICTED: synaptotagmin-4-like [Papilio polytes]|uniref:synaptotagmin-4-like n=1 Tax=Papilio polytes TaxID=76194 RepID=UPI0006760012|nr:PREDICTED: synaptotagmin-4-like [Papilio polytes]
MKILMPHDGPDIAPIESSCLLSIPAGRDIGSVIEGKPVLILELDGLLWGYVRENLLPDELSPGGLSPQTPTAPEPLPLSKELADAAATEKVKPTEPENNDGRLGDLHFKLRYEKEKSALVVSVVSCQGLPGREPAGPDPYVKLQLLPDKQHKVKTRVVRKTRCPVYDEDFTFYGLAPHQLTAITLHFVVLSFDRYSRDEIIGEVVSPLSGLQLHSGEAMALCREIQPRSLKVQLSCHYLGHL